MDELPTDWWHLAENEAGGYQYRTVVQVLDKKVETTLDGCAEIFARCKIAVWGTLDWHGLMLGGRALDCAGPMGLGFRPGRETHVLTRGSRCEDLSRTRKDRAYAFMRPVFRVWTTLRAESQAVRTGSSSVSTARSA